MTQPERQEAAASPFQPRCRAEVPVRPDAEVPGPAAARSSIYGLFARAFASPDAGLREALAGGQLESALRQALAALSDGHEFNPLPAVFAVPVEELAGLLEFHSSQFESGRSAVSLRESAHVTTHEPELLQDLFRCYEYFGLVFDAGQLRERPDLLAVELEFMQYLGLLGATTVSSANRAVLAAAQRDFLDRHPLRWIPALCQGFSRYFPDSFYRRLADQLHAFMLADRRYLQRLTSAAL